MIANAIDQYAGEGFWDILSDRDKRKILTATFNQDPLWVIRKFRAHDSVVVDFGEIWLGTTEEQIGWQKFYRGCSSTWLWGVMNSSHLSLLNNEIPLMPRFSKPLSILVARVTRSLGEGGTLIFVATTPCCCQRARIG
jgi:hypothetical protein